MLVVTLAAVVIRRGIVLLMMGMGTKVPVLNLRNRGFEVRGDWQKGLVAPFFCSGVVPRPRAKTPGKVISPLQGHNKRVSCLPRGKPLVYVILPF